MNMTSPTAPIRSLCLASAVVLTAVLAGSSAQAQVTQLTSAPAGSTATTTAAYPKGDISGFLYSPVNVTLGGSKVTFTPTQTSTTANSPILESFDNHDASVDFPAFTQLIDTFDGSNPTGPLRIDFSTGVSSFGIKAEDNASDFEAFTYTVFTDGSASGTTFALAPVDNTSAAGTSVFLGAQSGSSALITSVLISSVSTNNGVVSTGNSNDFYVGPLSTFNSAPVPEASTTVSFGLLLMLGLGGAILRKKTSAAKASAH